MSERPRPLILTLNNLDTKTEILEGAYKLSHTPEWRNIYVAPDRTPKEREEHKMLRDELKRRRQEGEENIVIRKGKIVKKNEPEVAHTRASTETDVRSLPLSARSARSQEQRAQAASDRQGTPRVPATNAQ